jgi:hypothetical protein
LPLLLKSWEKAVKEVITAMLSSRNFLIILSIKLSVCNINNKIEKKTLFCTKPQPVNKMGYAHILQQNDIPEKTKKAAWKCGLC